MAEDNAWVVVHADTWRRHQLAQLSHPRGQSHRVNLDNEYSRPASRLNVETGKRVAIWRIKPKSMIWLDHASL